MRRRGGAERMHTRPDLAAACPTQVPCVRALQRFLLGTHAASPPTPTPPRPAGAGSSARSALRTTPACPAAWPTCALRYLTGPPTQTRQPPRGGVSGCAPSEPGCQVVPARLGGCLACERCKHQCRLAVARCLRCICFLHDTPSINDCSSAPYLLAGPAQTPSTSRRPGSRRPGSGQQRQPSLQAQRSSRLQPAMLRAPLPRACGRSAGQQQRQQLQQRLRRQG